MKLKQLFLGFMIASTLSSQAQNNSQKVLFTIDNKPYYTDEFKRVYNKNIDLVKDESQKDLNQYLNLYIGYKLKINKAEVLGLQNNPKYLNELNSYRTQLAKNYLTDTKVTNELVQEAYERSLKEINASHILFLVDENALPADTLKAYNKAISIRKRILNGEDFGTLAVQYSEDTSAKENKGYLGYFSTFRMVYPFESGAYNTPVGQVSPPIRTRFGYHLIKVNNIRGNRGSISISHIMLLKSDNQETNAKNKNRIHELYQKIQQGESFEEIAKQFSEDKSSGPSGGRMGTFSSGELNSEEFEDVAFSLTPENALSKPFESSFGWHIVKLNKRIPMKSFEEMEADLKSKVSRDERSRLIQSSVTERLRKNYKISTDKKAYASLAKVFTNSFYDGTWTSESVKAPFSEVLLTVNETKFSGRDFLEFIQKNQNKAIEIKPISNMLAVLYEQFTDQQLNVYYNANLEKEYPEFNHIMSEYRDGLLLFDLMEKEIWEKAKTDTLGVQAFYNKNANQYQWNKRYDILVVSSTKEAFIKKAQKLLKKGKTAAQIKEALNSGKELEVIEKEGIFEVGSTLLPKNLQDKKGVTSIVKEGDYFYVSRIKDILPAGPKTFQECESKVINDYQQYLEENWVSELKKEFTIQVNSDVFEQVKTEIKS
ncbi:peptidylprolyl isomerase [Flavobacterium sp.]|uniref:peptidylprolyl isomerase n=1 Tax=Flavobacterium sp. TaxID=239 RepID=UPI002608ADBF|nr:peptidylprolyl isomerase [Flavobacterium sp.]MDD3004022.1 peptidylprolyl isomerase [Flavobacterium sp.]